MSLGIILSAMALAQSGSFVMPNDQSGGRADAAYEQLAAGQNESAIAHLEAALDKSPGDPAILINLGTAYSRAGDMDKAREAFRAAATSENRYRVELADGTWEDSRKIARLALDSLDRTALAAK